MPNKHKNTLEAIEYRRKYRAEWARKKYWSDPKAARKKDRDNYRKRKGLPDMPEKKMTERRPQFWDNPKTLDAYNDRTGFIHAVKIGSERNAKVTVGAPKFGAPDKYGIRRKVA